MSAGLVILVLLEGIGLLRKKYLVGVFAAFGWTELWHRLLG
jgi:hypothetical protein